ncbi:M24 family metallopeptidase [Urbifossiella limnaea]|uniref:Putative peptidase n=1 Tax=Urbifossiella limnaea TaxID=2528023 RepID=A0A517XMS3_9BACT|nr:Xaa-Pro peptidase family protein [Urbifossiella limnaea]QDU18776.1 putative peptidase [Urbifossiella limnaea]
MNYLALRRQALLRALKTGGQPADSVLVTHPANVTYLTGYTGDGAYLVLGAKHAVVVTDTRTEEQVKDECPELGKDGGLDLHVRGHDASTPQAAAAVLTKAGAKAVAVEAARMTIAELDAFRALAPKAEFVPVNGAIEALRASKDPGEVEKIKDAIRVAERAFKMFVATIAETDTEKEMVDALEHYVRRCGARCSSFPPIVAVGERGALPHAVPTARPLSEGSKLLVDWGADLTYKADITRVIRNPYGTLLTRRNKAERTAHNLDKVYMTVLAAQDAAIAQLRHGAAAKAVDAAARKVLAAAGYGDYFTHGLGHGIGLEIHEAPRIRSNSDDVLEAGMVVTLEPGVYIPGWGGVRIEDDFLITRDGCQRLTTLSRELEPAPPTA